MAVPKLYSFCYFALYGNILLKFSSFIILLQKYLFESWMTDYSGLPIFVSNLSSAIFSISKTNKVSMSGSDSPKLQMKGA